MQSERAAPVAGQRPYSRPNPNSQFQECRLPTAQTLPVSPHREFGVSHRQLETDYYLFAAAERSGESFTQVRQIRKSSGRRQSNWFAARVGQGAQRSWRRIAARTWLSDYGCAVEVIFPAKTLCDAERRRMFCTPLLAFRTAARDVRRWLPNWSFWPCLCLDHPPG